MLKDIVHEEDWRKIKEFREILMSFTEKSFSVWEIYKFFKKLIKEYF
jgi:hypothetical protein